MANRFDLASIRLMHRTKRHEERLRAIEVPIPVGGGGSAIPTITLGDTADIGTLPTTIRSDARIIAFADGGGSIMIEPSLLAGGGPAAGVALWDGGAFVPWGAGADGPVYCCVYSTAEDAFYIGGAFANVDGVACANIARLDCATFAVTPLGAGVDNTVLAIVLDEANGLVHVGGEFLTAGGGGAVRVATYNIGAGTWAAWGAGCDNTVYALALDTAANRCFVGGVFLNAGGAPAAHIAEYAFGGGGVWSEPGGGLDDHVHALVWESVAGILYIGGTFSVVALHVATWDGANFAQIGDGLDDTVYALAWDAAGGILYAGGAFLQDGTASIDLFRLARYVGGAWGDGGVLGQGDNVNAVCVVGSDLYVGGEFVQSGFLETHPLQNVCRYINATTPLEMGSGVNDTVYEMAADASGRVLVVGLFTIAGGENLPGYINFAARRDHIHGMPGIATAYQSGFLSSRDWGQFDGRMPQNGFEDRADSALGMVGSDLQIAPTGVSYDIYTDANLITKSAAEIAPIANDLTEHYVYFDTQGEPQVSLAVWDITSDNVPIATVYRDGATYAVRDERHGWRRDRWWHLWAHATIGARYASGLTATFADATFSIAQGVIYDEDISHDSGGAITRCRLWYRNAAGTAMRFESNIAEPWKLGGTPAIQYDTGAGLADVAANRYVCSYVYMTNDIDYPIYIVVGQAQYTTVALARNDALPATPGQGTKEWKLLYRAIYQRNGASATYIEATDFREVSTGPGSSFTPASHTALTNRDAASQHPATSVDNTPAGNIAATTVQAAINELDAEKGGLALANAWTNSNTVSNGNFWSCLTDGSTGGFRAGSGSDVIWYRSAANTWCADDHVTLTSAHYFDALTDGSTGGFRAGSTADVIWYRSGPNTWTTDDHVNLASGHFVTALTDGNTGGLSAGAAGDVLWYRGGGNLWQTPDSVAIDGGLNVGSPATSAGAGDVAYSGDLEATRGGVAYPGYIYVPLATPTAVYNSQTFSSVAAPTAISAATLGVPSGARGIDVRFTVKDSGGAGYWFALGNSTFAIVDRGQFSQIANVWNEGGGFCRMYSGNIYYRVSASGANTVTVTMYVNGYYI